MADFAGAVNALMGLQGPDVTVGVQGSAAKVSVKYREGSVPGGREKAIYEFTVDFDQQAADYKLTTGQISTETGPGTAGIGVQKNIGPSRTISFSKSFGPGGTTSSSSFDSKSWEDQIAQRVEAFGWTRRKGFFAKLFGK